MAKKAWLTPNNIPASTRCRSVFIPDSEEWVSVVTGALYLLTLEENFEQYGTLTPAQTAERFKTLFDNFCFNVGICRMIGEIIPYAGATNPDTARFMFCYGTSLLRAAYPELFAAIGTIYGALDSTHFNLPDLRGRAPIGSGAGPGLTNRAIGAAPGNETHALSTAELASHTHTTNPHTHTESGALPAVATLALIPVPSAIPTPIVTGAATVTVNAAGSGAAHNNVQPSLAINYLISVKS